ncbi:MAG: glycosyltransferase [Patescibacteria group bacterium]
MTVKNNIHPKNSYYSRYLHGFLNFLVPLGKKTAYISVTPHVEKLSGMYDYAVISDALGYENDVEVFLKDIRTHIEPDGRIIITQYNALWEPVARLASLLGLKSMKPQNWLSMIDLKNFAHLAGFEVLKSGSKMLMPVYIPLVSWFCNIIIVNIFPFSKLGAFHYIVARPIVSSAKSLSNPSVSIIVPARNESGTVEKIIAELPELGSFTEIIFIEGHSKDDTLQAIQKGVGAYKGTKRLSYAVQDGKGKGDAVRKGFAMATGDILMIYDADMTVPASEVHKFYDAIAHNRGDFINGSRLVYPLEKESMRTLNFFGNKFFSFAFSTILGQTLKDTLCGTKVLWKEDYEFIQSNRAFFGDFDPFGDFDLLFGAAKLNLKIIDMPIHYRERIYGDTNIKRWSHGWLLLKMTVFATRKIKFI